MVTSAIAEQASSRTGWRFSLLVSLPLRVFYSGVGALFGLYLPVNWQLVRSNALTETVPIPDHSLHYLLLGIWGRFDTLWYLHIARYGYDRPDAVVFFPLYPCLIRVLSFLIQPLAAALLLASLGAFFLFWGFQALLKSDVESDQLGKSVLVYAIWPSSFIFFAGYPESLLLALILWSLYFAKNERWFLSVALAIAAELTKAVGVIIALPLFVMGIRSRKSGAWSVLLTPLGALAFPTWVRWSGRGAISFVYEQYWRTTPSAPWTTLLVAVKHLVARPDALLVFNFAFLIIICAFVGLSRVRLEYKLFAVATIAVVLCKATTPPLQSMMRYVLMVFPAFVGMGQTMGRSDGTKLAWVLAGTVFAFNLALLWLFLGWSLIL